MATNHDPCSVGMLVKGVSCLDSAILVSNLESMEEWLLYNLCTSHEKACLSLNRDFYFVCVYQACMWALFGLSNLSDVYI